MDHARFVDESLRAACESAMIAPRVLLSAANAVTLNARGREQAGVPDDAARFAFVAPLMGFDWLKIGEPQEPLTKLLKYGGFAYFNAANDVVRVNAQEPLAPREDDMKNFLTFEPRRPLSHAAVADLVAASRFTVAGLPPARHLGIKYIAWIRPGEIVGGEPSGGAGGAIAAIFHGLDHGWSPRDSLFRASRFGAEASFRKPRTPAAGEPAAA